MPVQESVRQLPKKETQTKPKIPPKPVMPAKRYRYQNVQEFYRICHKSYSAYIAYKEQVAKWEKTYGDDNQRQNKESVLERLRNPPKRTADYQQQETLKGKDRGAR